MAARRMNATVHTSRLCRPAVVWWAVLLALMWVLLPTLNSALAQFGVAGAARMEICSTQGPQAAAAADTARSGDVPTGQDGKHPQEHCPFCLHPADRFALTPEPLPVLFLGQHAAAPVPYAPALGWRNKTSLWAPPRGPPVAIGM